MPHRTGKVGAAITAVNYYRWSLLQPVLLAALAVPSALKGDEIALAPVYAFLFSATSYAAWCAYALRRLRGKGEDEAKRLALYAPLRIALGNALFFVEFQVFQCLSSGADPWGFRYFTNGMPPLQRAFLGAIIGLIIGACFVFPVSLVASYLWAAYITVTLNVLKRWGWVDAGP